MIFRLSAIAAVLLIAPGAALAQAVCNPVPSTGAGTNTVSFDDAAYAAGIDCDTGGGDMTVGVTSGGVDIGGPGILLNGTGTDGIAFNSALEIEGVDVTGALLDIETGTGDIGVNAGALDADQSGFAAMTHGLRAISAGGNIDIVLTGTLDAEGGSSHVAGQSGIEARSTSGNGSANITTGSVSGRLRGIHAQSSGTGPLSVTTGGSVGIRSGGIAAIDATSGTGLMTLNLNGSVTGASGNAVRAVADGDVVVNVGGSGTIAADAGHDGAPANWIMDITASAGRTVTLNNDGRIRATLPFTEQTGGKDWDDLALRVAGGSLTLNNRDQIRGIVDFSGVTDGVSFNINGSASAGQWRTAGESVFGGGNDSINIASNNHVLAGTRVQHAADTNARWNFGGGTDTVNVAANAEIRVGAYGFSISGTSGGAGLLAISNLEAFNNAGIIFLGNDSVFSSTRSDEAGNDVLTMEGGTFTGSGASRIAMDVNFIGGQGQDACVWSPNRTVSDCIYFPMVTTAGSTQITIQDASSMSEFGSYLGSGILLVDVTGGVSAAEHFTLDPNSDHYVATGPNAGMLEKGYFLYALGYDEDAVQHKLVSLPNTQLTEFTVLAQAVQGIWQTSTGLSFDRQADLRSRKEGAGAWLRLSDEESERDLVQTVTHRLGPSVSFDNSYDQATDTFTGGIDMAGEVAGGEYAIGAMLSYVESDLRYDQSATHVRYKGGTIGLYGGYGQGPFRVDAAVNGVVLSTKIDAPEVGLPSGVIVRDMVRAVGLQTEASWRFGGDTLFLEPLAGLSHVSTHFDQIVLEQAKLDYDDPTSTRAGLGLRLGGETALSELSALRFDLAAKFWEELSGENTMIVDSDGTADLAIVDEFTGTFTEVSGSASLAVANGLSLFLSLNGTFGDDYEATASSAGFRYQW